MTWITLAFTTSLLISAITIAEKHTLHDTNSETFTAVQSILTFIIALPLIFFAGIPSFTLLSFFAVLAVGIMASIALYLSIKSLKELDISVTAPLYILSPAITSILAAVFFGGTPHPSPSSWACSDYSWNLPPPATPPRSRCHTLEAYLAITKTTPRFYFTYPLRLLLTHGSLHPDTNGPYPDAVPNQRPGLVCYLPYWLLLVCSAGKLPALR